MTKRDVKKFWLTLLAIMIVLMSFAALWDGGFG